MGLCEVETQTIVALVGALVTTIGGVLGAIARARSKESESTSAVRVEEIKAAHSTEGRLWNRIADLEDRVDQLDKDKDECREQLARVSWLQEECEKGRREDMERIENLEATFGKLETIRPPRLGGGNGHAVE